MEKDGAENQVRAVGGKREMFGGREQKPNPRCANSSGALTCHPKLGRGRIGEQQLPLWTDPVGQTSIEGDAA